MSLRILITGTTGDSMPPPYAGIPKVSLLYARTWKKMGAHVGVTWVYKPEKADDEGAGADYFFEYGGSKTPTKFRKALFLIKYFFKNPVLYFKLFKKYHAIYPFITKEVLLYTAYGVFMDGVLRTFKPDIILAQAALIKAFMVSELAHMHKIPIVYNTYAEVHDLKMGVNKDLDEAGRKKYWTYFMNLPEMVIGMDNCSCGPLMYLPPEKVKVFYDTCDFAAYQINLPDTKEQRRKEMGLPQDQFLVGMVGAYHYRKGHDQLIRAIKVLDDQGINAGAVVVGGYVGKEKWVALAEELGVTHKVHFKQNLSEFELVRLHKTNDMYANLSNSTRSCGLDLALLGAMAGGLPIVVYDNGALPGAVPKGENGFVVPTHNVGAVADAIKKVYIMSPAEREAMGKKSAEVAAKTDINLTGEIKLGWFKEIVDNYRK